MQIIYILHYILYRHTQNYTHSFVEDIAADYIALKNMEAFSNLFLYTIVKIICFNPFISYGK